jgi:hypothetical protein
MKTITRIIITLFALLAFVNTATASQNEGKLKVNKVRYAYRYLEYDAFLNGIEFPIGTVIENLSTTKTHHLEIKNEFGEILLSTNLNLRPNELVEITPEEEWNIRWIPKAYIMGGSWFGGGVDFMLNRYIRLEAGLGISYWNDLKIETAFFILRPYIGAGYYFIGDPSQDYRFGLGGAIGLSIVLPREGWETVVYSFYEMREQAPSTELNNAPLDVEIFAIMEWKRFYVNLGLRFNFSHPKFAFVPAIGMKF